MTKPRIGAVQQVHRYAWLWEALEGEASFVLRAMFGAKAVYIDGKLVLVFSARTEPWRGLLVCTSREHQPSLIAQFPALTPHSILPKWLYLPESSDRFESVGEKIVELTRRRDPRIGITPRPKTRKSDL